MVNMLY